MFGQGDEGIFLYENQGKGQFKEIRLLTFPPSYGSSFCSLYDFNQDGQLDILYTAGDNADYPAIRKPYHGIRIFENKGRYQFEETFFYHLNGAYKAIPTDFDQDGDVDLAAISFFPDYEKSPAESFVFLENQGDFKMKPYSFPEVHNGRWIVMETSDLEGDGDTDIVLGSLSMEVPQRPELLEKWVESGLPFLVLENQLK